MTGNRIAVGALGVRFLVESADSGGSVSVFECDVPADAKMPVAHSHDGFEETAYGLSGRTTFTVGGETVDAARPARRSASPGGRSTASRTAAPAAATFLAVATPGRLRQPAYFRGGRRGPGGRPGRPAGRWPPSATSCAATA